MSYKLKQIINKAKYIIQLYDMKYLYIVIWILFFYSWRALYKREHFYLNRLYSKNKK